MIQDCYASLFNRYFVLYIYLIRKLLWTSLLQVVKHSLLLNLHLYKLVGTIWSECCVWWSVTGAAWQWTAYHCLTRWSAGSRDRTNTTGLFVIDPEQSDITPTSTCSLGLTYLLTYSVLSFIHSVCFVAVFIVVIIVTITTSNSTVIVVVVLLVVAAAAF